MSICPGGGAQKVIGRRGPAYKYIIECKIGTNDLVDTGPHAHVFNQEVILPNIIINELCL